MKGIVNSMAKKIITEVEMLTLKELETDDYQHGESYSGEPLSIKVDIDDDVLNLKFFFQNTDEDIAEDWVNEFLTTNEFDIQSYELFSKGGEHSLVVASFARTEAGTEVDYSFTDEEIASLNIQEDSELPDTQQTSTNISNVSTSNTFTTSVLNASVNASTNLSQPKQKRAYKRKTVTTVLPATAASKQIALNLSGSGLSIKGQSNRVSTLNDQGQKVSAAKQIQAYIDAALPKLTAKEMTILTDAIQCKTRASLGYPLFMEVNPALTYKVQATFNGRYRYGKQILTIQGKNYYVTNHLFARNISKVKDLFTALGLLSPAQNTTVNATTSNVNSLINQSVQDNQSTNILSDDNLSDNSNQQGANISSNNVDVLSSETKVMSDKEFFERSAQLLDNNDTEESINESNENINIQSTDEIATDIINTLEKEQKQIEQDEQVIQDNWELDASSNEEQKSTIVNVNLNIEEQDEVNEVEK